MKVVITIQHPAHVHFFRNAIHQLQMDGHAVHVFTRERVMAMALLDSYGIDYEVLSGRFDSTVQILVGQLKYEFNLFRKIRKLNPDVLAAIGEPAITHASALFGVRSILFIDTEHSKFQKRISLPWVDEIHTPEGFVDDLGPKQSSYSGYHELSYLHPNRYMTDESVVEDIGIDTERKTVFLRGVAWTAVHDFKGSGFTDMYEVVDQLEAEGIQVVLSTESEVPPGLSEYQYDIPIDKIHHVLGSCDAYLGESATMAVESALQGTPAVFVSSFEPGIHQELQDKYGLLFNISGSQKQRDGVEKVFDVLDEPPETWRERRSELLDDKIDVTRYVLNRITAGD